jgi:hypothetical protein
VRTYLCKNPAVNESADPEKEGVVLMRTPIRFSLGLVVIATAVTWRTPMQAQTYVANQGSNNVSGFLITPSSGALSPASTSPFPAGNTPF